MSPMSANSFTLKNAEVCPNPIKIGLSVPEVANFVQLLKTNRAIYIRLVPLDPEDDLRRRPHFLAISKL